jgi:hypothetical protein
MKITYSVKENKLDHIVVEDAVSYTQTDYECLIFDRNGLVVVIPESDIEDFMVEGLNKS